MAQESEQLQAQGSSPDRSARRFPDGFSWGVDAVDLGRVDFDTLERTAKLSAEWFREAARQNAVV